MIYAVFALYVLSSALGMVLIKYGGKSFYAGYNSNILNIQIDVIFLLGILLYILSFVLWTYILQKFQVTFISPVAYGLTFIAIAFLSYIILKESMSFLQIIGCVLIICGVFISTLSSVK